MKISQLLNESIWKYPNDFILRQIESTQHELDEIEDQIKESTEWIENLRAAHEDFIEFLMSHYHLSINWNRSGFLDEGTLYDGYDNVKATDILWTVYDSPILTIIILMYTVEQEPGQGYDRFRKFMNCSLYTDNPKLEKAITTALSLIKPPGYGTMPPDKALAISKEQIIRLGLPA